MNDNADAFEEACGEILAALDGLEIRTADELLDLGRRLSFWVAATEGDLELIATLDVVSRPHGGGLVGPSKPLQIVRALEGFSIGDRMMIVEKCRQVLWTSAFPGCAAFQIEEETAH